MATSTAKQYKLTLKWLLISCINTEFGILETISAVDGNHKTFNSVMACLSFATAISTAYMTYKKYQKEKMLSDMQR